MGCSPWDHKELDNGTDCVHTREEKDMQNIITYCNRCIYAYVVKVQKLG